MNRLLLANGHALPPVGNLGQVTLTLMPDGVRIESPFDAGNTILIMQKALMHLVMKGTITLPPPPPAAPAG